MDVREKLVGLLDRFVDDDWYSSEEIAENLIAHGVTVQENCKACAEATQNCIVKLQEQIAELRSVQEWISVKERLPENDYGKHWKERKHYLVRFAPSGLMCVAHYGYKEYDWWIDEHDCVLSAANFKEVTHWMEISKSPQPPEGEC